MHISQTKKKISESKSILARLFFSFQKTKEKEKERVEVLALFHRPSSFFLLSW